MSEVKFLKVDGLVYKCEVDTKIEGVEFDNTDDDDFHNSLFIYLKCPMSALSMSQHDLLSMLFNDFISVKACYKYDGLCDILDNGDMRDIPVELSFKIMIKYIDILPNGPNNCCIVFRSCFLDPEFFSIEECGSDEIDESKEIKKEVKEPIKLTDEQYLRFLKKDFARNVDVIICCYETIDNMRKRNKELKKDIEDLEKQLSNNNI